jgi:hypothetical protein
LKALSRGNFTIKSVAAEGMSRPHTAVCALSLAGRWPLAAAGGSSVL